MKIQIVQISPLTSSTAEARRKHHIIFKELKKKTKTKAKPSARYLRLANTSIYFYIFQDWK